ncbi:uncharacterized protein ACA1_244340 [Acanthamoeba castellanii str. Neff]|uniref:Uncharacterized protein n=1 Tax=Acanthamoeba castellanii (strain ATCC 30010 / Neff) TaxID=1257118 RepID=L8GKP0_ACACF|nr:uncharacterized protein ACA1_244340 [Acanthamoeba castellanii str. Neff]ELR13414.1 hypothetical protein ACA1_244340 [Acanthamoeba castellanii str. Neff]
MGIRLWHLAKSIGTVGIFDIMGNGIPLPVSVGVLRSAVRWSVYFMWRQFDSRTQQAVYKWSRLLDCPSLATPEGFLHYTTFMWRLSVYGDLFASTKSHKSISAQDEQRDDDDDDNNNDNDDNDDDDEDAKEPQSAVNRSGSSGSSGSGKDKHNGTNSGNTATDLTEAILLSKVRPWLSILA